MKSKYLDYIDKQSNSYCVYGLSALDKPNNIVYIGYTNNVIKRYNKHIHSPKKINTKLSSWIKSMNNKNIPIKMCILNEFDNINDCLKCEIEYIKLFKSFGAKLKNHTTGGESCLILEKFIKNKIEKENKKPLNVDKIIKMFREGFKIKDIISQLNISQNEFSNIKKEYGLNFNENRPKIVKDFITKDILKNLYINENKTKKEISEITGISERNIKKRLSDFNIKKDKNQIIELNKTLINKRKTINEDLGISIMKDRNEGMSMKNLVEKYNLKYSTMSNFIYKNKTI